MVGKSPRRWGGSGSLLLLLLAAGAVSPAVAADPNARKEEPGPVDGVAISVAGKILTPDGKPIDGATVVLRAKMSTQHFLMGQQHSHDVLARTKSDAEGRFSFEKVRVPLWMTDTIANLIRGERGAQLLAWAEGRAIAWTDVDRPTGTPPVTLSLGPEAEVNGVVRDEAGVPQADARLEVYGATRGRDVFPLLGSGVENLSLSHSEVTLEAITDAEGRFALHHVPRNMRLMASCNRADTKYQAIIFNTGPNDGLAEARLTPGSKQAQPLLYSPLAITIKPGRYMTVNVVDHQGRAVRQGNIHVINEERQSAGQASISPTRPTRVALEKPGKYSFLYFADPAQPYLSGEVKAELPDDGSNPAVEIRASAERWLAGKLIDVDTKAGIPEAVLQYMLKKGEPPNVEYQGSIALSGPDGSFRIPVAAGEGRLAIRQSIAGYYSPPVFKTLDRTKSGPTWAVDVAEAGEIDPLTIEISRGLVVRGVVHNTLGKPAQGATVCALGNDDSEVAAAVADDAGRFELRGLSPAETTYIIATDADGAGRQQVAGEPAHPWNQARVVETKLVLRPEGVICGRVLKGGEPCANVTMKLSRGMPVDGGTRYLGWGETKTDAAGKYRLGGLMPGDQFHIEIVAPAGFAAPDWDYQSPYIQTKGQESELPDVALLAMNQALAGVLVDPAGQPVPDITVLAQMPSGAFLSSGNNGPPTWTKTDNQGRFELRGLPDERLVLFAHRANPKGGQIHYSAKARPAKNQRDVRIVFDPSLSEDDIEDLDAPQPAKGK